MAKIPLNNNLIVDKTFDFAVSVLKYGQSDHRNPIIRQLIRSGTSIGANVREAQNAESKLDFIHKFKIAAKEADETEYWLLLINAVKPEKGLETLLEEIKTVQKIITKIIASSKKPRMIEKMN